MANKTAMQDFLENIRNKKNTISRDVQNGHGHYYVIRLFEILEAECFSKLEKEKEQIIDAYNYGYLDYQILAHDDATQYYEVNYGKPKPAPFA
jgi:hypothetical protein